MSSNWFIQLLIDNVFALVFAAVAGVVMAFLKAKRPKVSERVLYGLATFFLIIGIWGVFRGLAYLEALQPQVTTENVETNVRRWADELGWGVQRTNDQNAHFALLMTLPLGQQPITVSRMKVLESYLGLAVGIALSAEDQKRVKVMDDAESRQFLALLRTEMAKTKISFRNIDLPLTNAIRLERHLPIAAGLTQGTFLSAAQDIMAARVLLSELIIARLRTPQATVKP